MGFNIELTLASLQNQSIAGRIVINDFSEGFEASLEYWNPVDYEHHWRSNIRTFLGSKDPSYLITSITNPSSANFIFWWLMYSVDDLVAFRYQILFFDSLKSEFHPSAATPHIPPRLPFNEEGLQISEWKLPKFMLKDWLLRNEL